MAQEKYGQLFGSNPACLIMNTQQQPTYDELCHLLGSAIGKPEVTIAEGTARTWTFTPKPIQMTATVKLPPIEDVRRAVMDVMGRKGKR